MKYDHVLKWLMQARLLERTPSMSDLNEVVFGQEHLSRNDLAFVFCLKLKFFDKVNTRLAAAEEALALSIWTTSTICHALSLETVSFPYLTDQWILPKKMLDFLDAPVPYIVGLQHKPSDIKMKTANLIQINVSKEKVSD
ncbi:hypothetical protein BHE74_00006982 [Ensete ventricosum]|nr:hypothetical protein GW17_00027706 [Ensete ventricosum]RWW84416.1 hypothetical protein BHE74_00006982 [Ensete ventricosum]RZS00068.1 hypothetical protein BHM03_00029751 [Ensete ventricosum]